jgi:hypothetical protein
MLQKVRKIVPSPIRDVDLDPIYQKIYGLANQKNQSDSESTVRLMVAKSRSGLEKDFCYNMELGVHWVAMNLPDMRSRRGRMGLDERGCIYHKNCSLRRSEMAKCVKE